MRAYMCDNTDCGKAAPSRVVQKEEESPLVLFGLAPNETKRTFEVEAPPAEWFIIHHDERTALLCSTDCVMRWVHAGEPMPQIGEDA